MFGPRAAHVHKMFQDAKASEDTLSSISSQMGLMAQLRHIVTELKVRPSLQPHLRACSACHTDSAPQSHACNMHC